MRPENDFFYQNGLRYVIPVCMCVCDGDLCIVKMSLNSPYVSVKI
jgi:hypothetical protein